MEGGRSLRESLLESVDDIDCICKQIVESLLVRDRKVKDPLTQLAQLFESKKDEIRDQLNKVVAFRDRARLIRELEECVKERNTVIEGVEGNLKAAEIVLMTSVFQANKKLNSVRQSERRPVNSEEIVKLAHQISKGYSVACPQFWQQGDPSRPFPTEPELTASSLAAPRLTAPLNSHQPGTFARQQITQARTPSGTAISGRGQSPMTSTGSQPRPAMWSGESPRMGYQSTTASPRGRGALPNKGGVSPFTKRPGQNSPRITSPYVSFSSPSRPAIPPVDMSVGQMSSDSSSSSSSDDESPK